MKLSLRPRPEFIPGTHNDRFRCGFLIGFSSPRFSLVFARADKRHSLAHSNSA